MQQHQSLLQTALGLWNAGRRAEATLMLNQLASKNDPEALLTLGQFKWAGLLPQDPKQARQLFQRASDLGNFVAAQYATNLMASGVAGGRDWGTAVQRLRSEARISALRRSALSLIEKMELTPEGDPASLPAGRVLSEAPSITLFERLFTAAECEYLLAFAEPLYEASIINDAQGRQVRDPMRTSDGATVHWLIENPVIHALNRRLAAASGSSADRGEALQILRYRPGQEYRPHLDFARGSENSRILTALVYLNDGYSGGETCFLETGLKVKGRKGDAIIFRNATPERMPDMKSRHAGLPVLSGTKYLASRWIREQRWCP